MAHVASPTTAAEFQEALRDGVHQYEMKQPIEAHSKADYIDVCSLLPDKHNGLTIKGAGGTYVGPTFVRCFDDISSTPMLSIRRDRDWELRIEGLTFDGFFHDGVSLVIEYAQQSIFRDLAFRHHGSDDQAFGVPFYITGPTCNFEFIQLTLNKGQGWIKGNTIRWISGLTQADMEHGTNRFSGVRFVAPPHNPPAELAEVLRITDFHNEGGQVDITGFKGGILYEGGHHNCAMINFINSAKPEIDSRGMSWLNSQMTLNGKAFDPMRKPTLMEKIFGIL